MKYFLWLFILITFSCADGGSGGEDKVIPPEETDLIDRIPEVQMTFNLDDQGSCSFDSVGYNRYAIPHIFTVGIETSRYIALNFTGEISIWTRSFFNYDRPGLMVLQVGRLEEIMLNDPLTLAYNGFLGDNHNLIVGKEYYIVVRRDTSFRLSTGCEGGFLPFGRKLASKDGGTNWIGHDNSTSWYRKSGIVMYTTD